LERQLTEIFDTKIDLMKKMKYCWGQYVAHEEDVFCRKEKWERDFSTKIMLVMRDNTNVLLCFKPTNTENNRTLIHPTTVVMLQRVEYISNHEGG
jgi:hypothetical protein